MRHGKGRVRSSHRHGMDAHPWGVEALEPRALLAAVSWTGAIGNNLWQTAGNWSTMAVPGAADDVTIDVAGTPTILFSPGTGNRSVRSLISREAISFSGGMLTVGTFAQLDAGAVATLSGGTLAGGTWTITGATSAMVSASNSGSRLLNTTVNGDVTLNSSGARLQLGGTTSVTRINLTGPDAQLGLNSGLSFSGEIVASGSGLPRLIGPSANDATVTMEAGSRIHGGNLNILAIYAGAGHPGFTFNNWGEISADVSGQTITIQPTTWSNAVTGVVEAVNGGQVTLASQFTNAGVIRGVTGTARITGTLNSTGLVQTLDATTGSWLLDGGTISGGTVNLTPGATIIPTSNSSSGLLNVTVNGDVTLGSAGMRLQLGGTTSVTRINLTGSDAQLGVNPDLVFSGEIVASGSGAPRQIGPTTGTVTAALSAGSSIHGGNLILGLSYAGVPRTGFTFNNHGAVSADVTGQSVTIQPTSWSNAATGMVEAVNGGQVVLGGQFTNAGVIRGVTGTVRIIGTLNNTGSVQTLDATTGSWQLDGGTISGGTVNITPDVTIAPTSNLSNRLLNVTVNGDVTLSGAAARLQLGGTTSVTHVNLAGAGAELGMNSGLVFSGEIVASGSGAPRRIGPATEQVAFTLATGSVIRGGNLTMVRSYGGVTRTTFTINNHGEVSADVSGETITIQPTSWLNSAGGVLEAANGGRLALGSEFTNAGVIRGVTGTASITGQLNNTGSVQTLDAGVWQLDGGNIFGGTVNVAPGAAIAATSNSNNRLYNVTVNGDVTLSDVGARLQLAGAISITRINLVGPGVELGLNSDMTFHGEIVSSGTGAPRTIGPYFNGVTATITDGSLIRGENLIIGTSYAGVTGIDFTLEMLGEIDADVAGQSVTVSPATVTIAGVATASAGTLSFASTTVTNFFAGILIGGVWRAVGGTIVSSSGAFTTIAANATLELGAAGVWTAVDTLVTNNGAFRLLTGRDFTAAADFANNGTLDLSAGSVLNVAGGFVQSASGTIITEIASSTEFGRVVASVSATIDGALVATTIGGYTPALYTRFDVVTGPSVAGTFASVKLPGPDPLRKWVTVYDPSAATLVYTSIADWDGNGLLNSTDVSEFINSWFADQAKGTLVCDFNGDGVSNSTDVSDFINLWFADQLG